MYRLKRINYEGKRVAICTQNENGPCPLLAIANVLALRGHISFGLSDNYVACDKLLDVLRTKLVETNTTKKVDKNREQALTDVLKILPSLQRGLDVNVKFASPKSFEFTTQLSTFDLFQTNLVHGWLPDPRAIYANEISRLSYNQVVERAIDKVEPVTPAVATPAATSTVTATVIAVPVSATGASSSTSSSTLLSTSIPSIAAADASETSSALCTHSGGSSALTNTSGAPGGVPMTVPPTVTDVASSPSSSSSSIVVSPGVEAKRHDTPATYACRACTFINQFEAEVCAVCGDKRPFSLSPGGFSSLFSSPKKDPSKRAAASSAATTMPTASSASTTTSTSLTGPAGGIDSKISTAYLYSGFLEDTAGQFTSYGLEQLQRAVEEKELCVFFRNNHFSVLTKLRGKLYSLITDEGFANHVNVIWESLESARGDGTYVNGDFQTLTPQQAAQTSSSFVSDADMKAILELSQRESGPPPTKRPRSNTPPMSAIATPIPTLAPSEPRLVGSAEVKEWDLGPKNADYWECPRCTTHNKPDSIDCDTCLEWQCQFCDHWNRSKQLTCQGTVQGQKCGRDKRMLTQGEIKHYSEIAKKRRDDEWKSFVANQLKRDPNWIVPPQPGSEAAKKAEADKKKAMTAPAVTVTSSLPVATAILTTGGTTVINTHPGTATIAIPTSASTPAPTSAPTATSTTTGVVLVDTAASAPVGVVAVPAAIPVVTSLTQTSTPSITPSEPGATAVVSHVVVGSIPTTTTPVTNSQWRCSSCEFDNEADMIDCDFCNLPRNHTT